jgi:formylmethanofuran dehydrogenase subunit E
MSRREYLQPYFDRGVEFHGWLSPGLVIGIFMVDLAKEVLGPRELIDAVVETKACVPDAIQLMTHCTYGNGWMVVKDWGKMALTLFDKKKRPPPRRPRHRI